ncbi:TylF/MycF/NovP-related O-methyltransferase [Loktanella agnita]
MRLFNKLFRRLGLSVQLHPPIQTGRMMSLEQRINMYHLMNLVLNNKVPGSFLELGCAKGQSAVMMQKIMTDQGDIRDLHVYDSFTWGGPGDPPAPGREPPAQIRAALIAHFDMHGLPRPISTKAGFTKPCPPRSPIRSPLPIWTRIILSRPRSD